MPDNRFSNPNKPACCTQRAEETGPPRRWDVMIRHQSRCCASGFDAVDMGTGLACYKQVAQLLTAVFSAGTMFGSFGLAVPSTAERMAAQLAAFHH